MRHGPCRTHAARARWLAVAGPPHSTPQTTDDRNRIRTAPPFNATELSTARHLSSLVSYASMDCGARRAARRRGSEALAAFCRLSAAGERPAKRAGWVRCALCAVRCAPLLSVCASRHAHRPLAACCGVVPAWQAGRAVCRVPSSVQSLARVWCRPGPTPGGPILFEADRRPAAARDVHLRSPHPHTRT